MENDERLSGALQENILTLLCFDDENCKLVRAALTPQLFGNAVFREVAGVAIDFIDRYGETIKEHLADELEHILKDPEEPRKAKSYERVVRDLYDAKDHVNGEYVMSQLHKFVRQQNLKSSVTQAVEALQDGRIDDAEVFLQKGLARQSVAFDPGLRFDSVEDMNAVLDNPEEEGFELGIPELDRRGLFPRRKTLTYMVAGRGMGKSWFITHCAKMAMVQRWSCVVITLEMGQKSYAARFLQAFFSISKREAEVSVTRFEKNRDGSLVDLIQEKLQRWTLKDDDIKSKLMKRVKEAFSKRAPLRIKAFPTGSLTMAQLEAYLDGLERYDKFTPDLICIDYPDLMQLPVKDMRIALGQIAQHLRGLAVSRNCAVVAVSQGNRDAEGATTVTTDQVAEDISKLAIADLMFTYSQTAAEHALGLARLLVGKARDEASKFSILMTQAYALGQFCLDSVLLKTNYWDLLDDNLDEPPVRSRSGATRDGAAPRRGREEEPDEAEGRRPRQRRAPARKSASRRQED